MRDRFLERHFAPSSSLDDRFELLDCLLEGQLLDVGVTGLGHGLCPLIL